MIPGIVSSNFWHHKLSHGGEKEGNRTRVFMHNGDSELEITKPSLYFVASARGGIYKTAETRRRVQSFDITL